MKTYIIQHFLFGLRWIPNPFSIGLKPSLIVLRKRFISKLISSFGVRITRSYFLNRLRYFNKPKDYAKLITYEKNKDHLNVINTYKLIPKKTIDNELLKHVRNSYLALNKKKDSLKIQNIIIEGYKNTLINLKTKHMSTLESGAVQIGTMLEYKENSPVNIVKAKDFQHHPIDNSLEHHFYLTFYNSNLKTFIPIYRSFTKIKGTGFLKLEYIHGRKPILSDISQIQKFQRELFKKTYSSLINSKSMKPVLYFIMDKSNMLPYSSKRKINNVLSKIANHSSFKKSDIEAILNHVYLTPHIFLLIDLKEDLVLQHADFGNGNIIINSKGVLKVYDWDTYKLGLPGSDILAFILQFTLDFNYVQAHLFDFLKKEKISNYHVVISYLVLKYLDVLTNQQEGIRTQENLHKAMDYLRKSPLNN